MCLALRALPGAGLDREPEQLQHLFACLSLICKHLAKLLAGEQQLLGALRGTQRLRHHRAEHVRALAAEALGFLFRCGALARLAAQCQLAGGWAGAGGHAPGGRRRGSRKKQQQAAGQPCRPALAPAGAGVPAHALLMRCLWRAPPAPRLRHASAPAIRVGVKAVLAEAAARPSDERLHAAGALLAEAALGVSHGLHSRASAVLGQMLREDILRPQDFKSAKVGRRLAGGWVGGLLGGWADAADEHASVQRRPQSVPQQAAHSWRFGPLPGCASAASSPRCRRRCLLLLQSAQGGKLTAEQIQARLAAAASVCLQQLAEHTRRGKCGELWQLVLGEVEGRLDRLEAAQQAQQAPAAANGVGAKRGRKGSAAVGTAAGPSAGAAGAEGLAAAANSAARGVALLSQLVEHGRGCRVESYTPLFRLAARLARPEFVGGGGGGEAGSPAAGEAEGEAQAEALPYGASAVCADFLEPPLSAQVHAAPCVLLHAGLSPHPATCWLASVLLSCHAAVLPATPCLLLFFTVPCLFDAPQVLRFLLALTLAHAKTAGASEGPAAIGKAAPQWAPVFARAPPAQLLAFIRAVITPPGGYDLARIFGQQMLGTLGRCLLAGERGAAGYAHGGAAAAAAAEGSLSDAGREAAGACLQHWSSSNQTVHLPACGCVALPPLLQGSTASCAGRYLWMCAARCAPAPLRAALGCQSSSPQQEWARSWRRWFAAPHAWRPL